MKRSLQDILLIFRVIFGCSVFGIGFCLFLEPNGLNAGGLSGLSMIFVQLTSLGSVGLLTLIMNLPLFAFGGIRVGKRFFVLSILGMAFNALFIDLFTALPVPHTEPLVGALYGGALCGFGLGMVFISGGSTGGSDIVVRLFKMRWQNVPLGVITICLDLAVAALTGLVFRDFSRALYSGIAIFISGRVVDAVVYRFDYSKVALIVSKNYDAIAEAITCQLRRGATYLYGQGFYSGNQTKVILTAVKRQQLAELKQLVTDIDTDAFIIVQEAHQVLGDGFARHSKGAL